MRHVVVSSMTGSVGKTTCKQIAGHIVLNHRRGIMTFGNANGTSRMPRTLMRLRPHHEAAIIEAGAYTPGDLKWMSRILHSDVVVILAVKLEHYSAFRSLEAIAEEKSSFLTGMRRSGVAWLNGDDPLVRVMQPPAGVRVRFFGTTPDCDLWADQISARWPDRLSFRVHYRGRSLHADTQLVGTHWISAVLGGLAIALENGIALEDVVSGLSEVPPFELRMQPLAVGGLTVMRDEFKSSKNTWDAGLEVLRDARATRRWVVAGSLDDSPRSPRDRVKFLARDVANSCDAAIFVGEYAELARERAVQAGMPADKAFAAFDLVSAAAVMKQELRSGDLVLLKGARRQHLSRLYFALREAELGPVRCWKSECSKLLSCDRCPELHDIKR